MRNSRFKAICLEHSVSIVGQQISKRGPSNMMLVGNDHRRSGALNLCFYVAQHFILQDERKSYSLVKSNGYAADHQSYCGPKKVRGKIWNLQDLGDNVRSYQQGWALMQIRRH
jgi:hypothetical protein